MSFCRLHATLADVLHHGWHGRHHAKNLQSKRTHRQRGFRCRRSAAPSVSKKRQWIPPPPRIFLWVRTLLRFDYFKRTQSIFVFRSSTSTPPLSPTLLPIAASFGDSAVSASNSFKSAAQGSRCSLFLCQLYHLTYRAQPSRQAFQQKHSQQTPRRWVLAHHRFGRHLTAPFAFS
jgi:hypothetical protein